jgi:iron(III) transport system substrate-binding protein
MELPHFQAILAYTSLKGFLMKSVPHIARMLLTVSLTLGSSLFATSSNAEAQTEQSKKGVLNLYSSRHYDVDEKINKMFTEKTGIAVQHIQMKEASHLVERIKAEGKATQADVVMTVDIGNIWRAADAGILAETEIPTAKKLISAELQDPKGKWYAVSQRARVIVYNKTKVKPEQVANYENLATPAFKGKVLIRSSNHVYNQSLVASFVQHLGKEKAEAWVKGIADNLARKPEGGDTDQIKAVAAGVGDVAIVNSYYLVRLLKSEKAEDKAVMEKIGVIFPNQKDRGTHVNISGAAVAANAPHKEAAMQYITFLLSPEVQALYAEENGEFPAVSSVGLPSVLASLGSFKADTTSLAKIGALTPEAVMITDRSTWR